MKYWIVVASKDHLQRGLAGGFMQANHGKAAPLKRMHANDWVICYSPKLGYGRPEKCQCFTAIGRIADENIYQHDMGGGFAPFRRNVSFLPARDVSILPLINELTFIKDKAHWGAPFRFGTLQIPEKDFRLIANQMVEDQSLFEQ
ncbi:MAG TPA: EVE domain-containing protein [Anaerolineales bacterium]|nr:EVE domain-containing protein [Anaerolineales bacterium]HLO34071.1 EVE domain-containing protein [Anaerolineales bacterium]